MTGTIAEIIKWLGKQDKTKKFVIKQYREKRSKKANAYYWTLVNKIANVLHTSKEEVHNTMIKRYSKSEFISVLSSVNLAEYYDYFDKMNTFKLNNEEFTSYLIYKGSSKMNTKEMHYLIDGIVSEAKELDIEVLTPDELAKLDYLENSIYD